MTYDFLFNFKVMFRYLKSVSHIHCNLDTVYLNSELYSFKKWCIAIIYTQHKLVFCIWMKRNQFNSIDFLIEKNQSNENSFYKSFHLSLYRNKIPCYFINFLYLCAKRQCHHWCINRIVFLDSLCLNEQKESRK